MGHILPVAAAAAAQESCSEHAREMRAEMGVYSVTGLAAIVVLAVDINSGMSLSYLQYAVRRYIWDGKSSVAM